MNIESSALDLIFSKQKNVQKTGKAGSINKPRHKKTNFLRFYAEQIYDEYKTFLLKYDIIYKRLIFVIFIC